MFLSLFDAFITLPTHKVPQPITQQWLVRHAEIWSSGLSGTEVMFPGMVSKVQGELSASLGGLPSGAQTNPSLPLPSLLLMVIIEFFIASSCGARRSGSMLIHGSRPVMFLHCCVFCKFMLSMWLDAAHYHPCWGMINEKTSGKCIHPM